jgi:hypothetical protein
MRKQILSVVGAAALLAGSSLAYAAEQVLVNADVPFQFTAGGQTLAAGKYQISETGDSFPGVLQFRDEKTGKVTLVETTSSLAMRENGGDTLVFDEVGTQHVLSEIHLEGLDGFYLAGMKTKHAHRSIEAHRKG